MGLEPARVEDISRLVGALRLTPRQIQEMFRILGHVFETSEENKGRLMWCLAVGSIAMSAFKVGDPKVFNLLGKKQFEPTEARRYLTDLFGGSDRTIERWFTIFLTGGGLKMIEGQNLKKVMIEVGFSEEGKESRIDRNLEQWEEGWGHISLGHFKEIHEKIEQILQWS
jgi:hypothetical protein